ncbi:MAG: alkaline phosphatase family protein [Myxococcales bacterium]
MMQIAARRVYLVVACAAALVAPAVRAQGGRLVVFVVVDQLRYQDLLWARDELGPGGFGGLGQPLQARYRAALTHTAPDHATLATGTYPDVHGIVGNTLLDDGKPVEAIDDPACENWRGTRRQGPGKLLVPTVADALKLATLGRARALALSFKDRGALFLAGRAADLALFWDYDNGELTSSRCYAEEPPAWLADLARKHPVSEWKDYVWTLSRPEKVYARLAETESAFSEPYGMGGRFPHRVGRGELAKPFYTRLRAAPPSTTIVLRAAEAGVAGMRLGDRGESDLLLVSLSGLDYVGHAYGTASRERLDMLLRMHDGLSELVSRLRTKLGNRVAFVLSADHGATPSAKTAAAARLSGVRVDLEKMQSAVSAALDKQFGHQDKWVDLAEDGVIALHRVAGIDPDRAARVATEAVARMPGIWRAVAASDMAGQDLVVRHSFHPQRSGDAMFLQGPLVTVADQEIANHGSMWNEDALVPVLYSTPGFRLRPVLAGGILDPIQIAPTLAMLLGIAPPSAAFAEPFLVPESASR